MNRDAMTGDPAAGVPRLAAHAGLPLTRRAFLATGGALVVSFALRPPPSLAQTPATAPELPASLKKTPLLDAWIRINADGSVTVFTGKAELGQGVTTALQQIAAEQLSVPMSRITMVSADTAQTPDEGYTAGSNSLKDSGTAIQSAAAQVREILVAQASQRLGVAAGRLSARDGAVVADDGRRLGYGEIVAGQMLHVNAETRPKLKDRASHMVMGKPVPRLDIPRKVTGGVAYVQDLRMPGMVHARVVRPPAPGARLASLDTASAAKLPGVIGVVQKGRFLAVVADDEFKAIRAMHALAGAASWEPSPAMPAQAGIHDYLLRLPSQDSVIKAAGDAPAAGGTAIEATYRRPYQMHGAIGPSCALPQVQDGRLTIWTHTQGVFPLRAAIAELVAMPPERIRCIHMEGAGCYGHNCADDAAADAALIALAMPGKPVRVQYMREQEHAGEPFGAAMIGKARATLDASGRIASWQYDVWSNTHSMRPGKAGHLAAGQLIETPFAVPAPQAIPQPEGGGDRNAIPLYAIANLRVVHHFIPEMPLRVSALRALGAYANVFAIESFVDELALAAKADPVEFRLKHLEDPRAAEVIRAAAEQFGWTSFQRARNRGRGELVDEAFDREHVHVGAEGTQRRHAHRHRRHEVMKDARVAERVCRQRVAIPAAGRERNRRGLGLRDRG
jgi:CO/xanthine dehydrogenase Mo-binding subunit